jgi:deoxyadenosine/deoxycytidine kinase
MAQTYTRSMTGPCDAAKTQLGPHIAVSGLIGAGKSTLVRGLAHALGLRSLEERVEDNPYFGAFYQDPERWAFSSFVAFVTQAFSDHLHAQQDARGAIQERAIREHLEVFGAEFRARKYLSNDDFTVAGELVRNIDSAVDPPDLLIHVDVDPAVALRRVQERGEPAERGITIEYLESLQQRYGQFLENWSYPLMRLASEQYDFRREADIARVAVEVRAHLNGHKSPVVGPNSGN